MGRVDGKVVLITGAARGQGRAHALRFAEEGADVIAMDLCAPIPGVQYRAATEDDLAETVRRVEALDRRIVARRGDVRNPEDVDQLVADGLAEFGHIDVVIAQAGITLLGNSWEITEEEWATTLDINLTGAWRVAKAVIPSLIEAGNGGSIMFTTSGAAARALGNLAHYAATKSGLFGMCREMAVELAAHRIRVNVLQPCSVHTDMIDNQSMWELFTPDMADAPLPDRRERMIQILSMSNMLPLPWVEPEDMAESAVFLASDAARMVTGTPGGRGTRGRQPDG